MSLPISEEDWPGGYRLKIFSRISALSVNRKMGGKAVNFMERGTVDVM